MPQIIPAIANADLDERVTILVPASATEGIPITGPSWIKSTVDAVRGQVPWLPMNYVPSVGAGSPGAPQSTAIITVHGPERTTPVPRTLPDSGYALHISEAAIAVECREPAGLVQALRTLGQLADADGRIPTGTISDAPRFPYRGIHLDVARHFFGASFIKRLLRLMASLGFNVFHWHLTEDQGWRIPIDSYPRLTEIGAYRTEADGTRYGGHYTKDEIRDVVAYAGALGILVVPEIELPGHARAAIAAYPELSCRGEQLEVTSKWGVCEDVFCAGNDTLFEFLGGVFDEVCKLFPSEIIHIGGDECPKNRWRECDKCNARLAAQGLRDYEELQSYVIDRVARMLAERGRKAIGWDEILEGGLPADTLVMSWRGTSGGITAAAKGHPVVMTPTSHCYFDYRQTDSPDAVGFSYRDEHGRIPVTTIDTVYQFDPLAGLTGDAAANVLGGQANVWSEPLETEAIAERMIAPRILAMAEVLWAYPALREFGTFKPRAQAGVALLQRMGWRSADVPELE